ncbi:sensor histidine kinase [Virgibacillus halophilus]
MKLHYQLNAAFTTLLLIIMAVTGYVIYSLLLNLLVQNEQQQLEQKGEILVSVMNEQYQSLGDVDKISAFLQEQDLQLFLYNRQNNSVLYSTMPEEVVKGFYKNNYFSNAESNLWEYHSDKYVISRILVLPRGANLELILLTPMKDLQAVQHKFIERLLIVFIIGAAVAVLLSYFLTNKLVTPLTRLKYQLKKIEKRKFDEIEPIQATGEIREVAKSVYDMANELSRYISSQQSFFQNASHELKTPLMTIQGYAEGIKENVFEEAEKETGLEVMVTEVKRLKKIINEMILLAKLDSEQAAYDPEQIDASELVQQVADRMLPFASENNVKLKVDIAEGMTIYADGEKMLRALLNLVVNGIRHAASVVEISFVTRGRQKLLIVEDDGDGIPPDLMDNIFHRFVKGKQGDTGLGLAIVRAIVEQSGGKITVENAETGGARFIILFEGNG